MDSDNILPIKKPEDKIDDTRERGLALTEKIYKAILPLLGPDQAEELMHIFKTRLSPGAKASLYPVVNQLCDLCRSPMKIEEDGDDDHFITSCTKCGYMDVFKK
jgi:hypothetical protein